MSLLQEAHHPANISRRSILTGTVRLGTAAVAATLVGCGGNEKGYPIVGLDTPTVTLKPGQTKAPDKTPTKDTQVSKEGILAVGNWQFEATDWQEQSYQPNPGGPPYGQPGQIFRDGWKYVTINGNMRNLGNTILSLSEDTNTYGNSSGTATLTETTSDGKTSRYTNSGVQFGLFTDDGNKYQINRFTLRTDLLPPGFSNSFFLSGWVPQIQKSYGLSALTLGPQVGNTPVKPDVKTIKIGEVTKDSPSILPNVKINNITTPWVIPNFGEITYDKTFSTQGNYDNTTHKYDINRYISLKLKNNTGQDISATDVSFVVFLKDGNTLDGTTSDYLATYNSNPNIPPGLNKSFNVHLAGYLSDLDSFDEVIKSGVLVGIGKGSWFTWQLP